jgi:hypothetical protein
MAELRRLDPAKFALTSPPMDPTIDESLAARVNEEDQKGSHGSSVAGAIAPSLLSLRSGRSQTQISP